MRFDLAIIGSGPGGYVAAIRAAQLGMKVVCVEKDQLGGVCLNWGCIPTKALIKSAEAWQKLAVLTDLGIKVESAELDFKRVIERSRDVANRLSKGVEFLFKKNQVTFILGKAIIKNQHSVVVEKHDGTEEVINADKIIIAAGARARSIPGIEIDGQSVISSKEALVLDRLPKSMVIIGAGAIGVEFAYLFKVFGSQVTLVEIMPQILPQEDEEVVRELTRAFRKLGIDIFTNTIVKRIENDQAQNKVYMESAGKAIELEAEYVLMAVGVRANSDGLGLENLSIEKNSDWIKVNEHYQTNLPEVFAIGDIIGNPCLAHVASAEGIHAVEYIAGLNPPPINYNSIPSCVYCQPQVASVGMSEKIARERGISTRVGKAYFRANGKAVALGEIEGLVKVVFDADTNQVIGSQMVGPDVTELLPELVMAIQNRLTFHQIKNLIHAHPTLSEVIAEAIHDAYGEAIHK